MRHLAITEHDPSPDDVKPFGRYGVGAINEHPAGLLVVAAVVLMTQEAIPESRWFLASALALGGIIGLVLWIRHR